MNDWESFCDCYAMLCDRVYRQLHPETPEDDGHLHTSDAARDITNEIIRRSPPPADGDAS
jgi:hypothetical protein